MAFLFYMELTQELLKELFYYKDGLLYWKAKPKQSRININLPAGCISIQPLNKNRRIAQVKRKQYKHYRLVFLFHNGYLPPIIDHINNDCLDDNIENLREATHSQNMRNRCVAHNASSKYLGVSIKKGRIFSASITVNRVHIFIGNFKTEIDAAIAYDNEAKKYHGQFANVNFK